jgi:hypothetical protein
MLEPSVAVGMIRSFSGLAVGLQTVAQSVQQIRHYLMTHPMGLSGYAFLEISGWN